MTAIIQLMAAGAARALLVLGALLAAGARADTVTWPRCVDPFNNVRALGPLPDHNATFLLLQVCKITEIKPGDFAGLPNLKYIDLPMNNIRHVDATVFTAVTGLLALDLGYNGLIEAPNFGALSLFPNMTTLDLAGNHISRLDQPETFSSMKQLKYLYLHRNHIEHLHPDIFKPLTNLETITLYVNKITYIPDGLFHNPSLQSINLELNLISHVAPGAIGSSNLEDLHLGRNKLTYLPEHFVLNLKNSSASLGWVNVLENPWQCSCLAELVAEARGAGAGLTAPERCAGAAHSPCRRHTQEQPQAQPSQSSTTPRIR